MSTESGGGTPAAGTSQRLFFALWPAAAERERLAGAVHPAVRSSGGRPVPSGQLHLTLAFLGSVSAQRVPELAEIAAVGAHGVISAGERLELSLGRVEYWPGPRVLCALPVRPPAALGALAEGLAGSLRAGGFAPDLKPFRPHVTVARKVTRPGERSPMAVVRWRFARFALIDSRALPSGSVYSVVETYPLCTGTHARK